MNNRERHQSVADTNVAPDIERIRQALDVIHSSVSSNQFRQDASSYLDTIKGSHTASYQGYQLLSDSTLPSTARYFGASLLEHSISHKWTQNSDETNTSIRLWILLLSQHLEDRDPPFLRNKIAELWVHVAKRSWGLDWMDMDETLVDLWSRSVTHKMFVLTVLETLSEDVFGHEDPAAGVRGTDLNRACVEIFTSEQTLQQGLPDRDTSLGLRCGHQGWLVRACELLDECIRFGPGSDSQSLTVRLLTLLSSIVLWMIPKAVISSSTVPRLLQSLTISNLPIQMAAIDTLHVLYSRVKFSEEDLNDLVYPLLGIEAIGLLQSLYEWTRVNASDIDADKYLMSKKISELLFGVGGLFLERTNPLREGINLDGFFGLLVEVLYSPSLHVSIPILHLWVRLLNSELYRSTSAISSYMGQLLELCSDRLVRYENMPEDADEQVIMFLNFDFDTVPERHAFLGNYHRFCNSLIELIVESYARDALPHLLQRATARLDQFLSTQGPSMLSQHYSKSSITLLRLDAEFSVIEAALRGYMRIVQKEEIAKDRHDSERLTPELGNWCRHLMSVDFHDPLAHERAIHLVLAFGAGPLKGEPAFAIATFYYIIRTHYHTKPECIAFNDAVEELRGFCQHQVQRLAMRFPDFLARDFSNIEKEIASLLERQQPDEQTQMRYSAVLFIITHRALQADRTTAESHLRAFLQPLTHQWQERGLELSLTGFSSFCQMLGIGNIQQYFLKQNAHRIQDWTSQPLDLEGLAYQDQMQKALTSLPLRSTKIMLSISIEKLDPESRQFEMAIRLWQDMTPLILPNLLKFISQAQAFHNPENWDLLPEQKGIVGKILTDRFWQVGISNESRDEFYARVDSSKNTIEGLASSIRSTIRSIRESGYRLIFYLSKFGEQFYSYKELPQPLSEALFKDSGTLSLHQMAMLIEMVKTVIEHCPPSCRAHFLPPVSRACFEKLDQRLTYEWTKVERRQNADIIEDSLGQEMRDESILRQLMFASVGMLTGLVGPPKPHTTKDATSAPMDGTESARPIRSFSLQTPEVLQPILVFCNHSLRMRDTRSCQNVAVILNTLVPEFMESSPLHVEVREYLSSEVLKSCITSIHDNYFVDVQRELATVVASIVTTYSQMTDTPRSVLCSLPSISGEQVDRLQHQLLKTKTNHRQQRALVLVFLEKLRGVSVSEQGKVGKPEPKKIRSAVRERYMTVEIKPKEEREASPELGGISEMFG